MRISLKIKSILLLLFLLGFLTSCGDRCIDEDEFYDQQFVVYANPEDNIKNAVSVIENGKINVYGEYSDSTAGGQYREWQDTGLYSSGDGFVVWVSGEIVATGGEGASNNDLSSFEGCKLCFKEKKILSNSDDDNCFCGPYIDQGAYKYEEKGNELGESCTDDGLSIDNCTCKTYGGTKYLHENDFFSFPKDIYEKKLDNNNLKKKPPKDQKTCKFSMGYGLYIGLWGKDGTSMPKKVYHLFITSKTGDKNKFCPANILKNDKCADEKGNSRWVFVYKSPEGKIFKKDDDNYHEENEAIKVNFHDTFYNDNKGSYKVQFVKGAWQKEDSGLFANIVTEMEKFLFGAQIYDKKTGKTIKKNGVVEFMYRAVLADPYVGRIITIGLVIYVTFFGIAFFMGVVELSKKELMMRLLKIGLVIMFTNPKAWAMYNSFVVGFFKDGMNNIVSLIVSSYSSIIEPSYLEKGVVSPGSLKVGSNFFVIDGLAKDLLSDASTQKILSLINMEKGKGIFAVLYIPAIYFLIFYFLYAMLDVVIKYIISLIKICIGLALGPVFIFFSLFEKTKDMFKNWLAFMGSRSLEIIILFALLHPFIKIISVLFKEMLRYKICPIEIKGNINYVLAYKTSLRPENIHDRSIFTWFEYFLKIGAMIFLTKSLADRASNIAGQIVSIGGISNADSAGTGRGESGFSLGGSIAKATLGFAKQIASSKYVYGSLSKVSRIAVKGVISATRAEVIGGKSVNEMVNIAFKKVGIRNRGVRSFVRDRQIDKFIGEAQKKADNMGLSDGKDREEFIRKTVMEKANTYINANKNKSILLGIDHENIMNRMDQKLVKEPLKNFIKLEVQRQKVSGKLGLEAEKAVKEKAKEWAKNYFVDEERTVSKFFEKSSIKSFVKKQSLMSASNAFEYAKQLKEVDVQQYDKFVEKFRDATNQNAIRRKVRFDKNEKTFIGKVKNKVNQIYGVINNFNPIYEGAHKLNPKKTLRKFDRKLKRLNDFEANKQMPQQTPAQNMSGKIISSLRSTVNDQNEFLAIKKDDNILKKAVKFVPNLLSKPISKIVKAYKNLTSNKAEFINDHNINQTGSYHRLSKSFDIEGKTERKSRQELEQIIKKIDRLNSKNPQLTGESYLEKLSDVDRIKFQKEVNKKIDELSNEIASDPSKTAQNIAEIEKLKNAIFQDVAEYNEDRTKIKFLGMEFDCKISVEQSAVSDSASQATDNGSGSKVSDNASSNNKTIEKLENLIIEAHKKANKILK